jgi:hypothetical protein
MMYHPDISLLNSSHRCYISMGTGHLISFRFVSGWNKVNNALWSIRVFYTLCNRFLICSYKYPMQHIFDVTDFTMFLQLMETESPYGYEKKVRQFWTLFYFTLIYVIDRSQIASQIVSAHVRYCSYFIKIWICSTFYRID